MTEVLVSELKLTTPPVIPQARSYLTKQQSEYTEYDVYSGNRIRVNIPRLAKSYLTKESYIRFKLNVEIISANSTYLMFDRCGAFGLLDRIEVYDYLGGTLLERTSNIPAMTVLLNDLNKGVDNFSGKMQAQQGYDGAAAALSSADYDKFEIHSPMTGLVLTQGVSASGKSICYEFCLPVPSFLGFFSEKYVPLHNGFSVDFFLNNPNLAFFSRATQQDSTTGKYAYTITNAWITNFEYCCQVMELGDMAESMVNSQQPLVVHTSMYRYFQDFIQGETSAQSSFKVDLNLNVVSLRNVRFAMRPSVYQSLIYPSYGHRIRNFLTNFNLQYGSSYLPELAGVATRGTTIPPQRTSTYTREKGDDFWKALHYTQAYEELAKTTDEDAPLLMSLNEFRIDTSVATGNTTANTGFNDYAGPLANFTETLIPMPDVVDVAGVCGKFAGGIDTRLSKKSVLSGIDTNGLQITLNGTFDSAKIFANPGTIVNTTGFPIQSAILDIWAEHDAFVQIIPGMSTTVTF